MIWGRTDKQKNAAKIKVGTQRIKFFYIPDQLNDGRWVWLEWVKQLYVDARSATGFAWRSVEVVPKPGVRKIGS